jgi:hypothetical protein
MVSLVVSTTNFSPGFTKLRLFKSRSPLRLSYISVRNVLNIIDEGVKRLANSDPVTGV